MEHALPPPPHNLWHAMTRYMVAAHIARIAAHTPGDAPPEFMLALLLGHTRASQDFAEAASVLMDSDHIVALQRFTMAVDRELGLGGACP